MNEKLENIWLAALKVTFDFLKKKKGKERKGNLKGRKMKDNN